MSSMRDGVEKLLTALAEWRKVKFRVGRQTKNHDSHASFQPDRRGGSNINPKVIKRHVKLLTSFNYFSLVTPIPRIKHPVTHDHDQRSHR